MVKVLISDKMSPKAEAILKSRGVEVDVITGLSPDALAAKIGAYDGLAIRSSTKVTADIFKAATNLKVVGRAGIGVDNIDQKAATEHGVVVMNTPYGNSVTTAEHAIAMMFALARQIPQANASTHAGKWEKSKFMGVELTGKKLGIIGCGNIGKIVANRALGLKMQVLGFDPFLSVEQAGLMGIQKVSLDELLAQADFITLHTPLNDKTRGILDAKALAKTKKGVRIINCARGGLIVEADLKQALDSGHVAGAALDVFEEEPATDNILFGHENMVVTPHLGASTSEAQEKVAEQVAEQLADYLLDNVVCNALNVPSVTAEEAAVLNPYLDLSAMLGSLAGQITETGLKKISIEYAGEAASLNTKPLSSVLLSNLLSPILDHVNRVNARAAAETRGIVISESQTKSAGSYASLIRVVVETEQRTRSLAGTVFAPDTVRIISVEDVPIEASVSPHMLYVRNVDKPGFIGGLGKILGDAGLNIASFHLGRKVAGQDALALLQIDQEIPAAVIAQLQDLPHVLQAKYLQFSDT